MSYPYLPVNPCCTDVVLNDPCGCNSVITNTGCNTNNPCSTHLTASSTIVYDGPALTCTTAEPCDTLNVILQKIDEIICNLLTQINILTVQVNNITTQIITINGDIININNQLDVCCSVTTTTTSTTIAPVICENFSLDNTGIEAVGIITTDCDTGELVATVLLPGVTNICVETDSPLTVPGTVIVTANGPCGPTTTTTSSTSSTSTSTTSTTTTIAYPCECLTFYNDSDITETINYKNCNNVNVGPLDILSRETLQVCGGSGSASDPLVTITVGANCIDGSCPTPSTTTTTTTIAECTCYYAGATIRQEVLDVTDNGQIILIFDDCDGNPQENIYDTAGFYLLGCVNFIPGINSLGLVDGVIVGLAVGPYTIYEQCCPESPTTSTTSSTSSTTTTSSSSTTTTTTTCLCTNHELTGDLTGDTEFIFVECGNTEYTSVTLGGFPQVYCIDNNYRVIIIGTGDDFNTGACCSITTTSTTTVAPTTTTTTTIPPTTTTTTTPYPYDCSCLNVNISQTDLDDATGNTTPGILNNTVYLTTIEGSACDGSDVNAVYRGVTTDVFCIDLSVALDNIQLFYYKNNLPVYFPSIDSTYTILYSECVERGDCEITTTTTTTLTPTTTTTSTSSSTTTTTTTAPITVLELIGCCYDTTEYVLYNPALAILPSVFTATNGQPYSIVSVTPIVGTPTVTISDFTNYNECDNWFAIFLNCPTTTTTTTLS